MKKYRQIMAMLILSMFFVGIIPAHASELEDDIVLYDMDDISNADAPEYEENSILSGGIDGDLDIEGNTVFGEEIDKNADDSAENNLSEEILSETDGFMPDKADTYQECKVDTQVSGTSEATDEDGTIWFTLKLEHSYMLKLTHSHDMFIYEQKAKEPVWSAWYEGTYEYGCLLKGTYYIKLYGCKKGESYSFIFETVNKENFYQDNEEKFDDEGTRNNDRKKASEYTINEEDTADKVIHGLMGDNNTEDWYHITADIPVKVTFNYTNYGILGKDNYFPPHFILIQSSDNKVVFDSDYYLNDVPNITEHETGAIKGDYFIKVQKFNTEHNNRINYHAYTITIEPAPFYKITYKSNGAPGEVPIDKNTYAYGQEVQVEAKTDSLDFFGQVFLGWSEDPAAIVGEYNPGDPAKNKLKMGNKDVTLYAIWDKPDGNVLTPNVFRSISDASAKIPPYYTFELEDETMVNVSVHADKGSAIAQNEIVVKIYDDADGVSLSDDPGTIIEEYKDTPCTNDNDTIIFRRITLPKGKYYLTVQNSVNNMWGFPDTKGGIYITTFKDGFDLTKDSMPVRNTTQAYDIFYPYTKSGDPDKPYVEGNNEVLPDDALEAVFGKNNVDLYGLRGTIEDPNHCVGFSAIALKEYVNGALSLLPSKYTKDSMNKSCKDGFYPASKKEPVIWSSSDLKKYLSEYVVWYKESAEAKEIIDRSLATETITGKLKIDEYRDKIYSSEPFMICVKWQDPQSLLPKHKGHALVVDRCRNILDNPNNKGADWHRLYLYDCNNPFVESITLDMKLKGSYWEKTYLKAENKYLDFCDDGRWMLNDIGVDSNEKPYSIDNGYSTDLIFIDAKDIPSSFSGKHTVAPSLGNTLIKFFNSQNSELKVTNSSVMLWNENGITKSKSDNIKEYSDIGGYAPAKSIEYVLPKDDYDIELSSGELDIISEGSFVRIESKDNVHIKLVNESEIELNSSSGSNVYIEVGYANDDCENYWKIKTNMDIGAETVNVIVQNGKATIISPIEQNIDLKLETEFGESTIENISTKDVKDIEIRDNVTEEKDGFWVDGLNEKGYDFTDAQIKPSVKVYDGSALLVEKRDYTVAYKNNTKPYTLSENDAGFNPNKAPSITITGKGNYDSTEVVYFKILPQNIEGVDFSADDITLPATGKAQKIKPELYWNSKLLKNKTDYTFAIYKESDKTFTTNMGDSITDGGNYVIRLTGNGNFTGTRDLSLTLTSDYKLVKNLKVGKVSAQPYTGSAITPKPEVRDGNTVLTEGEEYTLSYASNVNAGTGYVIIKGVPEKGYAGSRRIGFKITAPKSSKAAAYDISESKDTDHRITVTCDSTAVFMKGGAKPKVIVKYKGADGSVSTLAEGMDYKLSYKNNTAYGGSKAPAVVVSGINKFKGKRETTFAITEKNLDNVTLLADDVPYKNKANSFATKLTLTDTDGKALKAGKDYDKDPVYVYVNSTEVTSNGSTVTRAAGDPVDKTDIIPVNTVIKVTINAKAGSGYTGFASGEYKITTGSIASAKVTIPVQTYTGKPIELKKSDITVSVKGAPLGEADYDIVSYTNNTQKGTAKVTLRGKGNYGGLKTQSFKIKAKGFKWWWRK